MKEEPLEKCRPGPPARFLRGRVSEGPGWQLGRQEMSPEFKGGVVAVVAVVEVEGANAWCESAMCCYNRIHEVTTTYREKV